MRYTILFNLIVVLSVRARLSNAPFPKEYADIANEIRDTCLAKFGLTLDDYESFTYNQDRTVMCYVGCVLIEAGWMSEDGIMNFRDHSTHRIPGDPEEVQIYTDKGCPLQPDGDNCERAYKVLDCYHKYSETVYFP